MDLTWLATSAAPIASALCAIGMVSSVAAILAASRTIGMVSSAAAIIVASHTVRVVSSVAVGGARHARRGNVPVRLCGRRSSSHECDTANQCLNPIHCSIPLVNGAIRGRSDRSLMDTVVLWGRQKDWQKDWQKAPTGWEARTHNRGPAGGESGGVERHAPI